MKKTTYFFVLVILVAAAAVLFFRLRSRPAAEDAGGHALAATTAMFDKTVIDIGDVPQYSPIHGTYVLRNTGESGLLIRDITTNCYCTTAYFEKGLIKSKDSTVVTIRYDSTRIGIFQSTGIVNSNGSADPVLLILRGNVVARK